MRMRNFGDHPINLKAIGINGGGKVAPSGTCEIDDSMCKPGRTPGGGRHPSTIEDLTAGKLQPDDDELRAAWLGVPELPKPTPKTAKKIATVEEIMQSRNVPRGVAELLAAEQAAAHAGVDLEAAFGRATTEMRDHYEQRLQRSDERIKHLEGKALVDEGLLREAAARIEQLEAAAPAASGKPKKTASPPA